MVVQNICKETDYIIHTDIPDHLSCPIVSGYVVNKLCSSYLIQLTEVQQT